MTACIDLAPLLHALGLDDRHTDPWRDHYVTGPAATPEIIALVEAGHMEERRSPTFLRDGDRTFGVTVQGRRLAIAENARRKPTTTRAARRYDHWLDVSDAIGVSFGEYLRRRMYASPGGPS